MARAIWKGQLAIAALTCPVALHAAASKAERVSFHTLNRATGHRLRREYVDAATGEPVAREDQIKGYETGKGRHVLLEPEEIAEALPDSDKVLRVEGFIPCAEVDTTYFDRPYFITPADETDTEAYELIRAGLAAETRAALARAVLFRRVRALLIRPSGGGLVAHTLSFDYEVVPAERAFAAIPEVRVETEMLDLARHILKMKAGAFDPAEYDDRYDAALAELIAAKRAGRAIRAPKAPHKPKVADLMAALRESAGDTRGAPRRGTKSGRARKSASAKRKAG